MAGVLSRGSPRGLWPFSLHLIFFIGRATGGKIRKSDLTCMTWAGVAGQGVAWHGSKTSNLSALLPPDPCSGWTASQGSTSCLCTANGAAQ